MNQQLIFPELSTFDKEKDALRLDVLQAGLSIPCYIPVAALCRQNTLDEASEKTALLAFEQQRFYFEDLIEQAIGEEDFTSQGEIWLSQSF